MSLKSSNQVETNVYELEIAVDAGTFRQAVAKTYNKERKSIALPGFRKGKAPQGMIEKFYGEGVFYEGALDLVYPDAVEGAVKEAGLKLVDTPFDVDVVKMNKEEGVELKLKVTVYPEEVKLSDYKGLKAFRQDTGASDEDVEAELNAMQDRNARLVTVEDRPAQEGDTAEIDFEGFVDGAAFDGGKGENHPLELGSGQFIPGFEEQVVGHKSGEEFEVNVTFPEDYAEELAGKDAVFKVKIHEIKTKEVFDLDDEFAKDVSEFDTLEELKADIRKNIEEKKTQDAENDIERQLLEQIVEGMEAEIPEAMIKKREDEAVNEFTYNLQMQGLSLEMYLQYTGGDMESFRATFTEQAEKQVKTNVALAQIVELEGIEAAEEEIEAEVAKLAEQYGMEADAIRNAVPAEQIAADIKSRKALDFIKDNAKTEDAKKSEKKGPAKKPAAKKVEDDGKPKKAAAKKPAAKKADDAEKKPAAKKPAAKKAAAKKAEKTGEAAE